MNFDQFREVPTVEKRNRLKISQSRVSYCHGTVVPPLSRIPPIPSCLLCFHPLSIPLIRLTQEYLVVAHISGFITYGVGEWRHNSLAPLVALRASFLFSSSSSSSKGDVSFFENALKALKQHFFAGLQGQQLFLVLALELSVNGLLLKDRQPHISKVNKYLPNNS